MNRSSLPCPPAHPGSSPRTPSPRRRRRRAIRVVRAVAALTAATVALSGPALRAQAQTGPAARSDVERVAGPAGSTRTTRHLAPTALDGRDEGGASGGASAAGGAGGRHGGDVEAVTTDVRQPRTGYVWPLDPPVEVTAPFEAPPAPWAAGHRGVDLRAVPGTVVRAPAPGTVTFVGAVAGRGVVTVTHGDGLRSSVEPVAPVVETGTRVRAGDPVGIVAPDGGHCAAAACLHWGVRRGDVYLDPAVLAEGGPIVLLPTH